MGHSLDCHRLSRVFEHFTAAVVYMWTLAHGRVAWKLLSE